MCPRNRKEEQPSIDPSTLRAFQDACANRGENPNEVIRRWIKLSLAQPGQGKATRRRSHDSPAKAGAGQSRARARRKSPLTPRLHVRLRRAEYEALRAGCKQHQFTVSSLIRLWVAYLLKWHKQGGRIERKAEPEAFKDDPRAMVWDGYLQVHLQDADTLTALKDACRQRGVEHSRVMRGWITHILGLYRRGLDLNPPDLPKRRQRETP